jgi:acetyl-CoA carboxylase biotin carboxyl carrier protein
MERELDDRALGELVERVRMCALRFVREAPSAPRSVRIRAGEVVLEADWPDAAAAALPDASATAFLEAADTDPAGAHIVADVVGVFYHAPEPGANPYVAEGDVVNLGQVVGLIEAMKVMIPVKADVCGRVTGFLSADGEPVEYGDKLIAIATVGGPA